MSDWITSKIYCQKQFNMINYVTYSWYDVKLYATRNTDSDLRQNCRSALQWGQGTKIFKYFTCPAGGVTYNFHLYMNLSFKSLWNKEHKGVICHMTSSSNSFQSTCPVGGVLWEELLVLSRFQSQL